MPPPASGGAGNPYATTNPLAAMPAQDMYLPSIGTANPGEHEGTPGGEKPASGWMLNYLVLGPALGIAFSEGISAFQNKGLLPTAQFIERIPGVKSLGNAIDKRLGANKTPVSKASRMELYRRSVLGKLDGKDAEHLMVRDTVGYMDSHLPSKVMKKLNGATTVQEATAILESEKRRWAFTKPSESASLRSALKETSNVPNSVKSALRGSNNLTQARQAVRQLSAADRRIANEVLSKAKSHTNVVKHMDNLKHRLTGLDHVYLQELKRNQGIVKNLEKKGVGFFGRGIAKVSNVLREVAGAQSMLGGLGKSGMMERFIGPALNGAMTFGAAFSAYRDAPEGEKTKAFMHEFLGIGIFNFAGWIVAKNLLNKTQAVQHLAKALGFKNGFRTIMRIPMRTSVIGLATELLAGFVMAGWFQKVGEWMSHKIFGKPTAFLAKREAEEKGEPKPDTAGHGGPTAAGGLTPEQAMMLRQMAQQRMPQQNAFSLSPEAIANNPQALQQQALENSILRQGKEHEHGGA